MLRDIVTASIAAQPDMRVVGEVITLDRVASASEQKHADVVVLAQPSRDNSVDYWPLLLARPRMKVFAIRENGRGMSLYELRPHEVAFADVSALGLVAAIRDSLAGGGG